jgi:hypothetical protein
MLHLTYRLSRAALATSTVLLFAIGPVHAEEAATAAVAASGPVAAPAAPAVPTAPPAALPVLAAPAVADAIPGSAVAPGPGMSPQAPPVMPAPGGRAPAFGAPSEKTGPQFRIGGRFFGYEMIGLGRKPGNPPQGYSGTALHAPALSTGKIPFWGGSGATLNLEYGTQSLKAYVTYYYRVDRPEYQGYYSPQQGPGFGIAYLLYTPDPIGKLRLQFKAGSFVEVYGGPGQWGWGIFGPMLGLKGYGETSNADYDLTRDLRVSFTHGVLVNPGVPEGFPRGDYNSWIETGTSTWLHHGHLGFAYKKWNLKLHYASVYGTDDRTYLYNFLNQTREVPQFDASGAAIINPATGKQATTTVPWHPDGRMDTYLAEVHWQDNPWGQVGFTGGLYNFDQAAAAGNGVWWAVDWTQGTREMINKYLGPASGGTGKVAVVGAEWNFSVSSILWYPRSFTGKAPDIRVSIAAMLTRTLSTNDPLYKDAMGYFFGVDTEYRMTAKLSVTFQGYGESRCGNTYTPDPATASTSSTAAATYIPLYQRWSVYSLNPGIAYHTDWTSLDRIQLIYSRRFYSAAADPNTAQPFDRHMIALGGYVTF